MRAPRHALADRLQTSTQTHFWCMVTLTLSFLYWLQVWDRRTGSGAETGEGEARTRLLYVCCSALRTRLDNATASCCLL